MAESSQLTRSPPGPEISPSLRDYTTARVSLTRTGTSVTTGHALEFALAHAQARDAVYSALDVSALTGALDARALPHLALHSAAPDRTTYLRRPDLGRTLSPASVAQLTAGLSATAERRSAFGRDDSSSGVSFSEANDPPSSALPPKELSFRPERSAVEKPATPPATTLTIVLADGLSATAANRHAIPLLDELLPVLQTFQLTPIIVAQQARVALADPIGQALHADATLILIGERPGLSSPDSLGAYITWAPRPGRTDAERNCVSNIRPPMPGQAGLDYATAAQKIAWYLTEARRLGLTGVSLREPSAALLP
jgi:ethanolamine ammonia-lyase small subunit